ncbi:MAG: hypothetical protein MHM6MM_003773 [Cercozoa sp. M6MM]
MVQRLAYRRRHSYNTKSNKVAPVKTPGGKLALQYLKKRGTVPKCGDCGVKINGVAATRQGFATKLSKHQRTVSRAYGGVLCHMCVKKRVLRAFLVEEQRVVTKLMKERAAAEKKATKSKN